LSFIKPKKTTGISESNLKMLGEQQELNTTEKAMHMAEKEGDNVVAMETSVSPMETVNSDMMHDGLDDVVIVQKTLGDVKEPTESPMKTMSPKVQVAAAVSTPAPKKPSMNNKFKTPNTASASKKKPNSRASSAKKGLNFV
jgi:hypothetical protein